MRTSRNLCQPDGDYTGDDAGDDTDAGDDAGANANANVCADHVWLCSFTKLKKLSTF